jgi:hypothetical protein
MSSRTDGHVLTSDFLYSSIHVVTHRRSRFDQWFFIRICILLMKLHISHTHTFRNTYHVLCGLRIVVHFRDCWLETSLQGSRRWWITRVCVRHTDLVFEHVCMYVCMYQKVYLVSMFDFEFLASCVLCVCVYVYSCGFRWCVTCGFLARGIYVFTCACMLFCRGAYRGKESISISVCVCVCVCKPSCACTWWRMHTHVLASVCWQCLWVCTRSRAWSLMHLHADENKVHPTYLMYEPMA